MLDRFRSWPVFTFKDVEKVVGKSYAKLAIHNHLRSGKIIKMGKGVYSFHKDPVLAVFAYKPSYLGLEFALTFYDLWEQESIPVIITSRRVRVGIRQVSGENVLIRRIKPSGMFGYEVKQYYDFYIPISNFEKTLVDFIYYREPIPKTAFRAIYKRCDLDLVRGYLKRMGIKGASIKELVKVV